MGIYFENQSQHAERHQGKHEECFGLFLTHLTNGEKSHIFASHFLGLTGFDGEFTGNVSMSGDGVCPVKPHSKTITGEENFALAA